MKTKALESFCILFLAISLSASSYEPPAESEQEIDRISHAEPAPDSYYEILLPALPGSRYGERYRRLTMPGYSDNMPLFERAKPFVGEERSYETNIGVLWLERDEAYALYRDLVKNVVGKDIKTTVNFRTVVGIRGSKPGSFIFHGNPANRFNDTLVLLWIDSKGDYNVREFPATTKPGPYDFGYHASSFLYPNKKYNYINGWHREYNALKIVDDGYLVRDDANKNGHWDSDRDGWWPPETPKDHDRAGGAHNIHMGSVNAPLEDAKVSNWSAGCQVIPGVKNWEEFIYNAWTKTGDPVDYFLLDVRDIDSDFFEVYDPTPAKGTAKGTVFEDKGSGTSDMTTRLPQAKLTVLETGDKTTPQGEDALWSFSLESGSYTIKAECAGYKSNTKKCDVASNQTTWCSIGLFKGEDADAGEPTDSGVEDGGYDSGEEDTGQEDAGDEDSSIEDASDYDAPEEDIGGDDDDSDVISFDGGLEDGGSEDEDAESIDTSVEEGDSAVYEDAGEEPIDDDDDSTDLNDDDAFEEDAAPPSDDEEYGSGGEDRRSPSTGEPSTIEGGAEDTGCSCRIRN